MEEIKESVYLPMTMLDDELIKIIDKEIDNRKLKKNLNEYFTEHGLTPLTVNKIFNDSMKDGKKQSTVPILTSKEKILLVEGFKKFLSYDFDLDIKNFFSDSAIETALGSKRKDDIIISKFIAKDCLRENKDTYCCLMSYKEIMDYIQNGILEYMIDIQREPKYKKIGRLKVAVPMIDDNARSSILESMRKNKFENNTIILAYQIADVEDEFEDSESDDVYGGDESNFISPNNSRVGTFSAPKMYINDGTHRITASISFLEEYYNKNKSYPDRYFQVKIVVADKDRSKAITRETFLRSDISPEYSDSLDRNSMNELIEKTVEMSEELNGEVGKTINEMLHFGKKTTRKVLEDGLKNLGINTDNKRTLRFLPKKLADNLDILLEKIRKDSLAHFALTNNYTLYMVVINHAYKTLKIDDEDEINLYDEELIDKFKCLSGEEAARLRLKNKIYSPNLILKYFEVI